jgi:hypothetical protein
LDGETLQSARTVVEDSFGSASKTAIKHTLEKEKLNSKKDITKV